MLSKIDWLKKLETVEQLHQFTDGFKLLYCPWKTIEVAEIAFISLNPGKPPAGAELRVLSDERGNSYEIEQHITRSPITSQFIKFSSFMNIEPNSILTGVMCPFRSNRWEDFSYQQKQAGINLGREFLYEVTTKKLKTIVSLGNETTQTIKDLFDAKLTQEIASGWGEIKLRRFLAANAINIIQLPHLSTFKLFSGEKYREPLETIFSGLRQAK